MTLTVVEGPWVLCGIEHGTNWCFPTPCPGNPRDELTLLRLIQQFFLPGTAIITDGWKSYINLGQHGYIHTDVNRDCVCKEYDPDTASCHQQRRSSSQNKAV